MNRIKELRKERGLTQQDLANLLNVSYRSVGFYENEKRDPDTSTLKILSDFFEVSIDYLLGHSNKKTDDNIFSNAFHSISTDGLDPKDIEMIRAMVERLKESNKTKF